MASARKRLPRRRRGGFRIVPVSRSDDRSLLSISPTMSTNRRTMAYQKDLDVKISALTSEQIVDAMRRHIDPAKLSYVKAGDFKKAKTATP